MKSILMIGQSNMAGRGAIGEVEPIVNEKIFMLRNGRWLPMVEPINPDRNFAGISLAASFAQAFVEYSNEEIGLIPCADGGTGLDDWAVGGGLYENAKAQAKLAMRISDIIGIIWHQGENDSLNINLATAYEEKFLTIISTLKRDLNLSEKLPIVIGELGRFLAVCDSDDYSSYVIVNKTLNRIAIEHDEFAIANSEGLTSNDDLLHFNAKSLRELGKRYFQAFRSLYFK